MKRETRVIVKRNQVNKEDSRGQDGTTAVFLDHSRRLTREKRFSEAISVLGVVSKLCIELPMEAVKDLVESLIESYSSQASSVSVYTDPWSCVFCSGVLEDPVTIICGHSCCRRCFMRNFNNTCRKCKAKYEPPEEDPIDIEPYIKVNILISELVKKYWSRELEAIRLRGEGNRLYQRDAVSESVAKYTQAADLNTNDYLILGNRSMANHRMNKFTEALEDADKAIELKPDWSKSYFRKGQALSALHRYEEAVVVFFQCFMLEDTCSKALRLEIMKAMYKLITSKGSEMEDVLPAPTIRALVKFASQPNLESSHSHNSRSNRYTSDGESESSSVEEVNQEINLNQSKLLMTKNKRLVGVLTKIDQAVKAVAEAKYPKTQRDIDPAAVDKDDFDCALCFRMLWEPITTPCGHTYCKACLDRTLDHKLECPLCKSSIVGFQKSNTGVNEFIESTIKRMLPGEYSARQKVHEDELAEQIGNGTQIPVFVCTMSFPNVPCPLHVFEPRYRLMIRRVMENGTRQFGMCVGSSETGFSEYGTMLEIRDIQYFDDGRSVVDTVGGRRFKVLARGVKDGYNTATVEFLQDKPDEGEELEATKEQHAKIRAIAEKWFGKMEPQIKSGILGHYGDMPSLEPEYWRLASGPAWCWWVLAILPLDTLAQQQILSQTSLSKRLEALSRILGFMKRRGCF